MPAAPDKKALLITNIPTPYRVPLFNEIARQLGERGLGFKVVFGALSYPRRKWAVDMSACRFEYEVLGGRNFTLADPEKVVFSYGGLYRILKRERPAVVVANAFSMATTKLWLRSLFKDTRYIIWSGAVERKDRPESALRRLQRRALVGRASGFVAYGALAKDYLVSLGADENGVEIGINTVDTEYFSGEVKRLRSGMPKSDNVKRLLAIGHLSRRKRTDQMLHVLKALSLMRGDVVLDIVGDGEEGENLVSLSRRLGLGESVRFEGFKQQADVAKYLAGADCFLFPTGFDIWGLVLVEAMAAGLPCVASVHAGAAPDLIKEGVTGFAADFSDAEKTAHLINWILGHPHEAREVGDRASAFISENATLRESAVGFVRSIDRALKRAEAE